MPIYKAPVEDVNFLLNDVFQIDRYDNLAGFSDASSDVREAILGEAAKLSEEVFSNEVTAMDNNLARWVHSFANPALDGFFSALSVLGSSLGIGALSIIALRDSSWASRSLCSSVASNWPFFTRLPSSAWSSMTRPGTLAPIIAWFRDLR